MRKTYPFLYAIFLNYLQNPFEKENLLQSLSEISQVLEDQINAYLNLIVLFFAHDKTFLCLNRKYIVDSFFNSQIPFHQLE